MKPEPKAPYEIIECKSQKEWETWLAKNHLKAAGVWLRFYKKDSKIVAVNYSEALEEALCYGWIDGQIKKYDEKSWLQKFTPRRLKSMWSKRNIEHITRLTKLGKMKPNGLKQAEQAKLDGRWEQAYDSPSKMEIPVDFLKDLAKNKKAETFFKTLNKANIYAIAWKLQTAKKPETRTKRMKIILEMLSKEKKFH